MVPLALISEGEEARLTGIQGGPEMRKRLADLGLNVGMQIRVIRKNPNGPLILGVKESRLALGRGMAHRVMVELSPTKMEG
jgi:Fe2+ transport system protein FeoA